MASITLTKIQRDAFREVVATGNSTAKEATVKALLRRNLIEADGDGFALTKAGKAFLELDAKERAAQAASKKSVDKAVADKPKAVKLAETGPVTVTVEDPSKDVKANAAAAGQTDAKVTAPKAPAKPKAAPVDKDGTIRVSKQIRAFIAKTAVGTDPLAKKIAKADVTKDESVRIPVSDSELDVLRGWAVAMADTDTTARGDVRSANALVSWIDGMKARRAAKK